MTATKPKAVVCDKGHVNELLSWAQLPKRCLRCGSRQLVKYDARRRQNV